MIIVFDGVCNFCNAWVRFVLRRDRASRFRFASAQSARGGAFLHEAGLAPDALETILLVDGDRRFLKSEAVLRILGELGAPWRLARVFLLVPRALRDACYDAVATRRYGLFGKTERCPAPDPRWRDRFIS